MSIADFIKLRKEYIFFEVLIIVLINMYFCMVSTLKDNKGDLIYLDCLILLLCLGFFFESYIKYKNRYKALYNLMIMKKDISLDEIYGNTVDKEIMRYIIRNKEDLYHKRVRESEVKVNDVQEYISKWVHEIKLPISTLNIILDEIEDVNINRKVKNEVMRINFLVNSVMYVSRSQASAEDIFIKEERLDALVKAGIKNNAFFLIRNNIDIKMKNLNYNVYTDKKWMLYVLDQVINNSIKYMKENGILEFYAEETKNYIELCIKDNGIGIAQEDIERIFNKGFTGNNGRNTVYKSTGMGLFFVKKIINKLEHTIEVESEQGSYTLFKIRFYKICDYLNIDLN